MLKIQIILGSTREGRKGEPVAKWVLSEAEKNTNVSFELLDLKDYPLPFFENAKTPKMLTAKEHTPAIARKWVEKIDEADGYIIVTPEYNHSFPAVLKNALDYPYKQWNDKPVAFVSYGWSAYGTRAVQQLRPVVLELQMVPIHQGVHLPVSPFPFDREGKLTDSSYSETLNQTLTQLIWWTQTLKEAKVKKK